jgi:hypothetical protein
MDDQEFSNDQSVHYTIISADAVEKKEEIFEWLQNRIQSYIWHKDPMVLWKSSGKHAKFQIEADFLIGIGGGHRLEGRTVVDDCIDDEWFIVSLLRDLTLRYEDAVI